VYCGYLLGEWRAVSINLQLDAKSVLLNDSALSQKGREVLQLPHVRELELLCMKSDRPIGEWLNSRKQRTVYSFRLTRQSWLAVDSACDLCSIVAILLRSMPFVGTDHIQAMPKFAAAYLTCFAESQIMRVGVLRVNWYARFHEPVTYEHCTLGLGR
jgi:hypothetical protein